MSFPKYPKYKASGVDWLGDVPEHWAVTRLKNLSSRISSGKTPLGGSEVYVSQGVTFLRSQNVYDEGLRLDDVVFITEAVDEAMAVSRVVPDDILLNITGASIGRSCVVPRDLQNANVNQHVCVIRLKKSSHVPFAGWLFKSATVKGQIDEAQNGAAREGLNFVQIGQMSIPLPPAEEQQRIAAFLDSETARIDALIAEQRRLIELLKEKRQAVISYAVTKGLNPNAPMKPSGIDWLGDVPEHWEVKPMRTIANVVRGASPRPAGDARYFGGDVIPWVTVAEITKDDQVDLTETESFLTEEGAEHSKRFPSGTVIYSNSGATLGVPKILRMDACANDGVVAFERLNHGVHPQFLYHYLASITNAIREKVKQGSGQPNLNTDIVKALQFGVPPLVEQQVIVRHIEQLAKEFGSLTTEAQRGIDLLQERRTALISAAVTGKIDVREFANVEAA